MMAKRVFLAVLAAALIMSLAVPASFAAGGCGNAQKCVKAMPCDIEQLRADGRCNNDAWKKLGRGACNVLTFPLELPSQISRTNVSDGAMAAFTWGLLKGVGMTAFRAAVGVYEIITFPFPVPEGYKPILTEPEFFFEDQIY
jgi:putative exosortase-associated protein (TIGR04073 family)